MTGLKVALCTQNASTDFKDKVQCLRCDTKFKVKVRSPKTIINTRYWYWSIGHTRIGYVRCMLYGLFGS